jgi:hypothetical protein
MQTAESKTAAAADKKMKKPRRKRTAVEIVDRVFLILTILCLLYGWLPQIHTVKIGVTDTTVTDYYGNKTTAQVYSAQYVTDSGKNSASSSKLTYPQTVLLLSWNLSKINEFMCDADTLNVYFDVQADGRTLERITTEKYDNLRVVFPENAYYVGKTFPELLQKYKDGKYLVLLALSNAGSETMSPEVESILQDMGFQNTPSSVKSGDGWIGVWNDGKVVDTKTGSAALSYDGTFGEHTVQIESCGSKSGSLASLSIDGIDYGGGQTGLCCAVYDLQNNRLIDSMEYSADAMATLNRNNQFFKVVYRPVYKSQFLSHVNAAYTADARIRRWVFSIYAVLILLVWGSLHSVLVSYRDRKKESKAIINTRKIILNVMIGFAGCLAVGWHYLYTQFSAIELQQLLYHLTTNNTGTDWGNFRGLFIQFGVALAITVTVTTFLGKALRKGEAALAEEDAFDHSNPEAKGSDQPEALAEKAANGKKPADAEKDIAVKKSRSVRKSRVMKVYTLRAAVAALSVVAISFIVYRFCDNYNVFGYVESQAQTTSLYDDYYVDAAKAKITFPEKKKNLIYIYLESMEITPASTDLGGGKAYNGIPELADLSLNQDSDDFNGDTGKLNGGLMLGSTSWTVAGMVAQTSGVPLNIPSGGNKDDAEALVSLPGVTSLGDVLEDNGYHNVLFIGSDAKFANRNVYFQDHGNYDIDDYYWAIRQGLIPKNYYVWWGYEDKKLFDFAKDEANTLASGDQPFNLTLLTTDTHFSNGYVCDDCPSKYPDQYGNVIACSSKRVADFVAWCKQQPWYDNTVIVLSGDHLYMDQSYYKDAPSGYQRKTYVTVVNAAKDEPEKAREFCTLDLFPTTLSAMGCTIEGDRLGLGTDIYSSTPTLTEQLGKDTFNYQLGLRSEYYENDLAPHKKAK